MRNELNLWVIGGDMRQAKLAELLADDGHTVHAFALEQLGKLPGVLPEESLEGVALADCVVLPLPVARRQRNAPRNTIKSAPARSCAAFAPTCAQNLLRRTRRDGTAFIRRMRKCNLSNWN